MSIKNLLNIANEAAATELDLSQAQKGGGGGHLFPAGYAFARLVEVIELGDHRQEYMGELKDPAPQVRLGFAISGEGYEFDGKPGLLRTYELTLSAHEKAKTFKLFKKLNYKGTAKTFAQLLNETYLLKVAHTPVKSDGKPRAYIDLEGFLPPTDPVTKKPYEVMEAPEDMFKLFLWNNPTKEMWDSLYQEGEYPSGMSKNFLQERCLEATNFCGSALETLLGGGGIPSLTPEDTGMHSDPADVGVAPRAPTRKTEKVA